MKAVLIAAGEGSRLRPFSDHKNPKIMLPFLGKPILGYQVEEFLRAGLNQFVVICNPRNLSKIKRYLLSTYPQADFKLVTQKEQLGPAHAIYQAKKYLAKEDFFIFKYTDSVTEKDQVKQTLKAFNSKTMKAVVTLKKVSQPEHYGVARFSAQSLITEIVEKPVPEQAPSNLANTGTGILNSQLFFKEFAKDDLSQNQKEVPPQQYVLSAGGQAGYWIYKYISIDLGRPWNILEVNRLLIDRYLGKNKNYVSADSVLGKNIKLDGYVSLIGVQVGDNCYLKNSYILPGAKIGAGSKIIDSVIGRYSRIGQNFETLKAKGKENIKIWVKDKYLDSGYKTLGCFIGDRVKIGDNLKCQAGKVVYGHKDIRTNIEQDYIN